MECLQELESVFNCGKRLERRRAVVAIKPREINAPQSAGKQLLKGEGTLLGEQLRKLVRSFAAVGRFQMCVFWTTNNPRYSAREGDGEDEHPTSSTSQQAKKKRRTSGEG